MSDRRRKLLFDAIAAIDAAREFVADVTLAEYEADKMRRSATERQLEILGEACSRLSREDAEGLAAIPTARLAVALRHRIIHGYDSVDDETVHRIVTEDLPTLQIQLRRWLDALGRDA